MKLVILLVLAMSAHFVLGARILAVVPISAKSHHIFISAILRTLAEAGNEVVCYSGLAADTKIANMTIHHLETTDPIEKSMTKEMMNAMLNMSPVGSAAILWQKGHMFTEKLKEDEKFLQLINSNEKFDLIFMEAFFAQEVLFALGHKFNAPIIHLQPFGAFSLVSSTHGNPLNLAYIPDFALPYSDHMSFYERAVNAYSILSSLYPYYTHHLPNEELLMRELFKDPTLPPIKDLIQKHLALTFSNAHPYVHYAQPYTPNIVPVGGIHLAKERKPLPPDVKKFLDDAPEGVIYFSVGSILPDHLLGDEYFNSFLSVFRRLPQRVLWKTNQQLRDLPNNVMTAKWIPQQDVLAHPNTKLFMTHGGLFSQHEAINAGVPVVCTPFFGDQPLNAKFYEEKGIGVILHFKSLSQETIYSALTTVIKDPKYRDNMARMSRIYRDRPISPADTLVFWVEYTLRHGGAPHLRPASASMPLYQIYLLDILGALIAGLSIIIVFIYVFVNKFVSYCWRKNRYSRLVSNSKKGN